MSEEESLWNDIVSSRVAVPVTSRSLSVELDLIELRAILAAINDLTHDIIYSPHNDPEVRALQIRGRNGWAIARFEAIEYRARRRSGY